MRTICGTILAAAVALTVVGRVDAAEKTWSGAANNDDWTDAGNYQGGLPSSGDTVVLPAGASVQLNDADSFTFVNTLGGITPASNATLTVTLAAGVTNSLEVPFTAYPAVTSPYYGRLVKMGGGTLFLNSMKLDNGQTGEKCHYLDYYCRLDITEGDVAMNQRTEGKNGQLGIITISNGATLFTYGDPTLDKMSADICATWFAELWGDGSIRAMVQPKAQYQSFWVHPYSFTPEESEFSGYIGENIRIYCEGRWRLSGTQNVCDPSTMIADNRNKGASGPRLVVAKLGNGRDDPSSIGKGKAPTIAFRANGGYILYTGNGEKTDRKFHAQTNNPQHPSFIDAGAYGGLDLAGDVSVSYYQGKMERLVLTGSNSVPCQISGELTAGDEQKNGATGGLFFIKRGSGTWRFADAVSGNTLNQKLRNNRTTVTIEEGTLQFDSLADTNRYCSLGLGTRLQEPYSGAFDASHNVDYFFRLGRTSANGSIPVLELSGLGSADWGVNVGTRKVAMAGSGRISNASNNRFRLGGVSALAGGEEETKYLYLGGTRDGGDEILDLTDGAGKLGVVKDGSGTWTLGGDVNFTGLLDVREGTLVVKRYNSRNTWFRFTITEMLQNSDYYYHYFVESDGSQSAYPFGKGYQFGLAEFGLFDASGNQVNMGVTNCWKSSEIEANGIAYDYAGVGGIDTIQYNGSNPANYNLEKLCDRNFGSTVHSWWADNCGGGNLSQTNSSGWASFVLRLPPGAAEVSSWDVGQFYNLTSSKSGILRNITACILESSPDGVNWSVVTNVTRVPLSESNKDLQKYWCSDLSTTLKPHTGWPLQGDSGRTWTVMPNTPVKVAAGATLRADISANEAAGKPVLNNITVDLAGGGTIDGFAFASSGTLNVKGLPKRLGESKFIPLNFANADGLGNVARWTLMADGEEVIGDALRVTSDGITVITPGMTIVIF